MPFAVARWLGGPSPFGTPTPYGLLDVAFERELDLTVDLVVSTKFHFLERLSIGLEQRVDDSAKNQ